MYYYRRVICPSVYFSNMYRAFSLIMYLGPNQFICPILHLSLTVVLPLYIFHILSFWISMYFYHISYIVDEIIKVLPRFSEM